MRNEKLRGHLAILFTNVIFGFNAPLAKIALGPEGLTAPVLSLLRIVLAAILFWGLSCLVPRERVLRRDLLLIFFASLFAVTLNQPVFLIGLGITSPFNASMLSNTMPILTMLMAALFLREPMTWKKIVGVLLGVVGAGMLLLAGPRGVQPISLGDGLILLSLFSYVIYLTLFKNVATRYSPVTLMKWVFLFSALCCLPVFAPEVWAFDYSQVTPKGAFCAGYVALFATFLSYLLIPIAQHRLRPTVISMYGYTQPIIAGGLSLYLGMESFTGGKLVAVALIFSGVYLVSVSKGRVPSEG